MSTHSQSPEPSAPLSSQTKHHGSGRHWTDEESALLEKHRQEYRDANDAARAEIFSRVLQDMLDILPNGKSFKKEERSAVKKDIKEWFARYSRKRSQKMPRMGKSWHARHVFQHENKDAIDTEAKRLCAKAIEEGQKRPKGGDPTHFDFRERVVTQMMGKLKKREKDVLQRTAEEYNKKGVDPELKSKLAVKNCTAWMHAFSKELYDTMGVWVFILGCYLKPDGNLDVSTYDFNQELGNGKDFIDNHSWTFHEEGISVSSWRAHNEEYYGLEDLALAKGGHRSQGAMTLEKNLYLEPILPNPSKPPLKTSRDIQIWRLNVLRTFVNQHYTGQSKGSAPWTAIGSKLLDFIDLEYIPPAWRSVNGEGNNFYKFLDPSKFPMEMVTEALQFCVGKGKKPGRSKGQRRGRAATESPSDEEARPKRKEGVEDRQFDDNSWKDLDVDKPAKKRTEQFSKDDWTPDWDGSDDDGEDLDVEKPTKKPTKQHDEHREDGSDDSDSDSDNGQERPKQDTLTEPTVKPSRVNPTLEEDRDSGSDLGSDDATITVDTSPELQPRYNDTRALSHEVPSDTEVLADDTFWEADLGCGVESADRAKKRKFTDEEDTPCKFPRLEKGYKLGPRSARPGKVKC
ncbi:uncharacterized protein LACBIDRAFT_335133 [Laccaria bicolor S238N-H82]|uniref:Predicted protein n=1 Tax=Laccaria bicolor (strain S238N-H82 / ATCC MYA-4686) TaxID=486041 RepID=B0E1G6_LACBS|nr:uncharacterized protein LACBIDRAFT_335133 [Laccaria bicolor S238N-H82]EDQ99325.1 predicted protein [Laccaria bicolor S238N-H82]|eukprot:XP_001890045.1 predicted protein [Laccaria bicolor S238N-H82]